MTIGLEGVGYGFFRSHKFCFASPSAVEFFFRDINFFLQKQYLFFKAPSANRIFFSANFRGRKKCSIKFADRKLFSQKNLVIVKYYRVLSYLRDELNKMVVGNDIK